VYFSRERAATYGKLGLMRRALLLSLLWITSCGPGVNRPAVLAELRAAINEEVPDEDVLDAHNALVIRVRENDVLQGMRRAEVEEALGRGQECGSRQLCADQEFRATDWTYEVGRRDGTGWGPTLIVGFDSAGIVDGVYTLTRHPGSPAQ
jgi:hypothetical protein